MKHPRMWLGCEMLFLNMLTCFLSLVSMVEGAQDLLPIHIAHDWADWFGHSAGVRKHVCIYEHAPPLLNPLVASCYHENSA